MKNSDQYFCVRGFSYTRIQDEKYARWKFPFTGLDPRVIAREEAEYDIADMVSAPSGFVAYSFVRMGYLREKLFLNPYGARLERFHRVSESGVFTVMVVGQASLRKGFLYLRQAFSRLHHPRKNSS